MAGEPDTLDLAGPWLVRADPGDRGVALGWHDPGTWSEERRRIDLPGAMQRELGADHRGVAWVARTIELPHSWRKIKTERVWIRFESVATDATVWVNGVRIGRHVGDFIPFQFEITKAAAAEVWVVVRVDQVHAARPLAGVLTENGHITKGFHDVLSLQHSGVWCGVSLHRTGPATLLPNRLSILADAATRSVRIKAELDRSSTGQHVAFSIRGPDGELCGGGSDHLPKGMTAWEQEFRIQHRGDAEVSPGVQKESTRHLMEQDAAIQEWSPEHPQLYTLILELVSGERPNQIVETRKERFAFRAISTGGPDNRHILLNDKPLLLRGILHWGHEPDHISPAPLREQIRAEFAKLKELGFNCVCLCMWYPPEHYYDIADEMGMLIWQEHAVWKSPMQEEQIPEYQRLFEEFFRRDRRHPSVIIVSGSCEHERFNPRLAEWWWKTAQQMLPGTLKQLQTGFIAWTDPGKTDLHDEHVYDSSGRWVRFVEDVRATTRELPRKPFVMGETIIGTAWADTARQEGRGEWWYPKGAGECRAFEEKVLAKYGKTVLERFITTAQRQNIAIRKFQSEVLRSFDGCAGWVMNQIRDVPVARLGFMDDFGRWRFRPEETRAWLGDRALLLRMPRHFRGVAGGSALDAEVGLSNFGPDAFCSTVEVSVSNELHGGPPVVHQVSLTCDPGEVGFARFPLAVFAADRPARTTVRASGRDLETNTWTLWRIPDPEPLHAGILLCEGLPFSAAECQRDFEERGYSSGWGLGIRSWTPLLQAPSQCCPSAPTWEPGTPIPSGTSLILTHRLTAEIIDFMMKGGRIVLLANKTRAGLSARFINVWGQCPLVIEQGPLAPGDSEWIADLLHIDLFDRHPRAIPVDDIGITDQVEPIVRLIFTHDRGTPKAFDAAFRTRVGSGLLIVTSLDHTGAGGRYLLSQLLAWGASVKSPAGAAIDPAWLRKNVMS